ncbi:hypothetical protein ACW5CM_00520 [Microbacterium sp. A588]
MEDLVEPMAELSNFYARYATSVELGNASRRADVEYWAPAPPPLTLAAHG